VARLFLAQSEAAANNIADSLNSKYIIIDEDTVGGMFYAVATYAGTNINQYFDVYYVNVLNQLKPVLYYYPQYYQSLAIRLYLSNGNEMTSNSTLVIAYADKMNQQGVRYKEISDSKTFPSYEEAAAYVSKQASANYRIASTHPLVSPLPLARLEHYKLVYPTDQQGVAGIPGQTQPVKIFEYVK
jgi:hypothetical protein